MSKATAEPTLIGKNLVDTVSKPVDPEIVGQHIHRFLADRRSRKIDRNMTLADYLEHLFGFRVKEKTR